MILMTALHRIFICTRFSYIYDEPTEKNAHQQPFLFKKNEEFHDELLYNFYFNP